MIAIKNACDTLRVSNQLLLRGDSKTVLVHSVQLDTPLLCLVLIHAWFAIMIQMSLQFAFSLLFLFFLCGVANGNQSRAFSEEYIEGLYGRFFEYNMMAERQPCPRVIDHINKGEASSTLGGWIVPHDKILAGGIKCNDGKNLLLKEFDESSSMPEALASNNIASETFNLMKESSTGFWLGVDDRTCGKWVFPNPSFVFFVKELDKSVTTSFRLSLKPKQKYMFVVSTRFTCIYVDLPRKATPTIIFNPNTPAGSGSEQAPPNNTPETSTAPTPSVIVSNTTPKPTVDPTKTPSGTGSSTLPSQASQTPASSKPANTEEPAEPTSLPSPSAETTDVLSESPAPSSEQGDKNLTIVDVANGMTPEPSPSQDKTIMDIVNGNSSIAEQAVDSLNPSGDALMGADGASLCFPADATVELSNGAMKRIDEIDVGDSIRVGQEFSHVFGFTHRISTGIFEFVRLTTEQGKHIELTGGHFLYVNGQLQKAGDVQVGDRLRVSNGESVVVTYVTTVRKEGLYNPQTLHGDIVVNGIVSSTYTQSVDKQMAHALLTPLRAAYSVSKRSFLGAFESGYVREVIVRWCRRLTLVR